MGFHGVIQSIDWQANEACKDREYFRATIIKPHADVSQPRQLHYTNLCYSPENIISPSSQTRMWKMLNERN